MLLDETTSHSIKHKPLLYLQNQENGNSTMRRHWWSLPVPQEKSLLFEDNIFSSSLRGREVFVSVSQMTHEVWENHLWNTFLKKTLHNVARQKTGIRRGGDNNNTISWILLRPVWRGGFMAFLSVSQALCKTIYHSFVPFLWIWQAAIFVWFLKHPPNNKSSSWEWVSLWKLFLEWILSSWLSFCR